MYLAACVLTLHYTFTTIVAFSVGIKHNIKSLRHNEHYRAKAIAEDVL